MVDASKLVMPRVEKDEARDFREWLRGERLQFDEAPRHSPAHRQRGNGVEKGRADFVIPLHGKQCAIELKRADGGEVREAQVKWLRKFRKDGGLTAICFGAVEAIEQVRSWGRP